MICSLIIAYMQDNEKRLNRWKRFLYFLLIYILPDKSLMRRKQYKFIVAVDFNRIILRFREENV